VQIQHWPATEDAIPAHGAAERSCEQIKAVKKETVEPTWADEILNAADSIKQPPHQPYSAISSGNEPRG
jgi:hypothetical protein